MQDPREDTALTSTAQRETLSLMLRALTVATLFAVWSGAASGQELSVLHIKVTLTDAAQTSMPVPRHALLISDDPPTARPGEWSQRRTAPPMSGFAREVTP
jgi:hypothetical protein